MLQSVSLRCFHKSGKYVVVFMVEKGISSTLMFHSYSLLYSFYSLLLIWQKQQTNAKILIVYGGKNYHNQEDSGKGNMIDYL